jgi:acyl transferase domain-containing protein
LDRIGILAYLWAPSRIGYLESLSGLAAMIKVVMAFEQGFIPPSINFESPNPGIDLEALKLKVG